MSSSSESHGTHDLNAMTPIDKLGMGELEFEGIAKRKLDDLLARGWEINGYSIRNPQGELGLVTTGAFVGWFTVADRNGEAARANFLTMQGAAAELLKRAEAAEAQLKAARGALTVVDAELAEHGYATIGTLRATVLNALTALSLDTKGDGV